MKKRKLKYILLSELVNDDDDKPDFAQTVLSLIEKKVFIPLLYYSNGFSE